MKANVLKLLAACFALLIVSVSCTTNSFPKAKHRKIALQCYTFKEFTFEETLMQIRGMDFDALEGTPAQKISAEYPVKISPDTMSVEDKQYLKKLLSDARLKFVSYGVVSAKSEADIIKYCEFAREFGIEAILTEDAVAMFPIWEKYGKVYGIKMYRHHHASDSSNQFFDPDVMMKFTSAYQNVMANPDNGHWSRSNINSVEGFKKLKGKIGSIHFKDQKKFGDTVDAPVVYGTGELELEKVLAELDAQGYDGYFVIEYEVDWENPLPAVRKCLEFLRNN